MSPQFVYRTRSNLDGVRAAQGGQRVGASWSRTQSFYCAVSTMRICQSNGTTFLRPRVVAYLEIAQ
jgi:hypothetical protein